MEANCRPGKASRNILKYVFVLKLGFESFNLKFKWMMVSGTDFFIDTWNAVNVISDDSSALLLQEHISCPFEQTDTVSVGNQNHLMRSVMFCNIFR